MDLWLFLSRKGISKFRRFRGRDQDGRMQRSLSESIELNSVAIEG